MSSAKYFTLDHRQTMGKFLADEFRKLWAELHGKHNPTPEWFKDWLSRVPNIDCGCQDTFRNYVKETPPDFDDFYAWSVKAHNWVNAKLGKPIFHPRSAA